MWISRTLHSTWTRSGFGKTSCFSFYPGKNLGAYGEGGALVTNNGAYAARARALREHGSTQRYYYGEVGFNYRMEGMQGAVLGVKLKHLDAWTAARRRVAARYHELMKSTPLRLPLEAAGFWTACLPCLPVLVSFRSRPLG